jgi:hypothetical protein
MSDDKYRAYQPTGSETLETLVMDPNIPKSETEGWACREIERLRARVEVLEQVSAAAQAWREDMTMPTDPVRSGVINRRLMNALARAKP